VNGYKINNSITLEESMKKVKIVFLLIILIFVGIVIFQNKAFFMAEQSLVINLMFVEYTMPEIANIVLFLTCFFIGLLIGYFYFIFIRFKLNKTIRRLNSTINSHQEIISDLEKDVGSFKSSSNEVINEDLKKSEDEAPNA
jgi:cell division protein FtsL